jgi:hypothetical protein
MPNLDEPTPRPPAPEPHLSFDTLFKEAFQEVLIDLLPTILGQPVVRLENLTKGLVFP